MKTIFAVLLLTMTAFVQADPVPLQIVGIEFNAEQLEPTCPMAEVVDYNVLRAKDDHRSIKIILVFKCAKEA